MTKRDARSLNPEAQEEIRRLAVKKYKEGIKIIDIAKDIEVHRTTLPSHSSLMSMKPDNFEISNES